jgi:hypothetical protein
VGVAPTARVVPLDFLTVQAFDSYEFERTRVAQAAASDFVFVNLFRVRGRVSRPPGRASAAVWIMSAQIGSEIRRLWPDPCPLTSMGAMPSGYWSDMRENGRTCARHPE